MPDNTTIDVGTHKSLTYNECISDLFKNPTIASTARKTPCVETSYPLNYFSIGIGYENNHMFISVEVFTCFNFFKLNVFDRDIEWRSPNGK